MAPRVWLAASPRGEISPHRANFRLGCVFPTARLDGGQSAGPLHVLRLGEPDLAFAMIAELLAEAPNHAHSNYAHAMIFLARGADARREAAGYQVHAQEGDIRHEAHWRS